MEIASANNNTKRFSFYARKIGIFYKQEGDFASNVLLRLVVHGAVMVRIEIAVDISAGAEEYKYPVPLNLLLGLRT
jgi:hypothetical protein